MKNAPLLPLLALATLLAGCQVTDTPTQEPQTPEETASAEAAFDAIKSLEGTWAVSYTHLRAHET